MQRDMLERVVVSSSCYDESLQWSPRTPPHHGNSHAGPPGRHHGHQGAQEGGGAGQERGAEGGGREQEE